MINLIFHNVEQGTDKWLEIKAGKFSGTDASTFVVKGKNKDQIGTGLLALIPKKVAELVVGIDLDGFNNKSMQRGNDLEPLARSRYEMENFADVEQIGFIQSGEYLGFSPDGLVGQDGLIEIKCLEAPAWIAWIDSDMKPSDIQKKHYTQIQWGLFISGRKWCDYVMYNPDFAPLDYTQTRVDRDEKMIELFAEKSKVVEREMVRLLNKVAQKEAA